MLHFLDEKQPPCGLSCVVAVELLKNDLSWENPSLKNPVEWLVQGVLCAGYPSWGTYCHELHEVPGALDDMDASKEDDE